MATSSNNIVVYDRVVEWQLLAGSGTEDVAGSLQWWMASSADFAAPNNNKQPPDTGTWWNVKTITYMADVAGATGGYVQLNEKDTSGPVLFKAILETAVDVYSQTYSPALRCRPVFWSSLSEAYSSKDKFVFHLA